MKTLTSVQSNWEKGRIVVSSSSDLDPLDAHVSAPNGRSIGSKAHTCNQQTHRQTGTPTTLRATSVTTGRICALKVVKASAETNNRSRNYTFK